MTEAAVSEIELDPATIIVEVVDEYEGGTTASNAQAEVEFRVQGVMDEAEE